MPGRLRQYEAQTKPLIEFFRETSKRLVEVDASVEKPEVIFGQIRQALNGFVAESNRGGSPGEPS